MSVPELAVEVVRVFVNDDDELGNELGIVISNSATVGREQELAARIGFSETVFIDGVDVGGERTAATIRIFTPTHEMPFAGHPSVGTAWWLASSGQPVEVLVEPAGDVLVRNAEQPGDRTFVTARGSWAPEFEWRVLPSLDALAALDPAAAGDEPTYHYAWIDEPSGSLRSRMFARVWGIPEDQATGAAAVRLTALLERDLDITQGLGSRITTRLVAPDVVELGGRVVADEPLVLPLT